MPKRLILVFAIASMVPPILRAQTPAKPQAPAQTPAKPQAPAAPAPAPAPTQAPGKPQTPAGGQAPLRHLQILKRRLRDQPNLAPPLKQRPLNRK